MIYEKTEFTDGTAPYLNAANLNKIGQAIEDLALQSIEPCGFSASSTASAFVLETSGTAPTSDELPLIYVCIPTLTNVAGATIKPAWSGTAIPMYDISTNAAVLGGAIRANIPYYFIYDGTKMWVDGRGGGAFTLSSGNTAGTFDKTNTNPTGSSRLNYSGYFYATQMWANAYNSLSTADIAEGYPVEGEYEPGDLIAIVGDEKYSVNDKPLNHRVIGFVSDEYAALFGTNYGKTPVACAGRIHAKVNGPCQAGDFLVASAERGCVEVGRGDGIVVAQALADKKTQGVERILVRICH